MNMLCPSPSHRQPLQSVFSEGETDFRICKDCGLVFRSTFPTSAELDAIYRQAYVSDNIERGGTHQESGDYAIKIYADFLAKSLIPPGMRVLDFGAATGVLVEQLRRRGLSADGMEFSADARNYCALQRGFDLMGGLDEASFGSYDAVTMIEVIEHLTDLWGTLRGLRRALRPGGLLFVTTPNRKGIRALMEGGRWREARKKFHLFLFDAASLTYHLRATGFDEVTRLAFSPILKPGMKFLLAGRVTQAVGVSGTLCMVARRT